METYKVVYEIRYPKILNFRDLYKEIINPYFVYPNTKYAISDENFHTEAINLTFLDSNYHLVFAFDRISFQFDGSHEELLKEGSHLGMCFDIFNKIKTASTFTRISAEILEITVFKEINKDNTEIVNDFAKKHNIKKLFSENLDTGIVIEGSEKTCNTRINFGPFDKSKDISALNLFSTDKKKELEFSLKKGIIARASLKNETSTISKSSFKNLVDKSLKYFNQILSDYE
ncbi:MAG: hypothetical protein R2787_06910 [Saprospiraceae bacterium]